MAFDSLSFFLFFTAIYCLYLILPHRAQNYLILISNLFFYAYWDLRLLALLAVSSVLTHTCAVRIDKSPGSSERKKFLVLGVAAAIVVLVSAKLWHLTFQGSRPFPGILTEDSTAWRVIIPLGVSIFSFQMAAYCVEVYRGRLRPVKSLSDYVLFASFFPLFMAGPIEKAGTLLPQILEPRRITFEKISEGVYLVLWGFFLKLFIADNLAPIAAQLFSPAGPRDTLSTLAALYAFAFQIYGILAGYSNIGRGTAKLLGIDLKPNFQLPYFSSGPVEFWRRWNVSLSAWLKDYVYIPLNGSARGGVITARNLSAAFLLGGLWYGTGWTILLWCLYHIALILGSRLVSVPSRYIASTLEGSAREVWMAVQTVLCFHLVAVGWIFFGSSNLDEAAGIFKGFFFFNPNTFADYAGSCGRLAVLILPLFLVEVFQKLWEDHLVLFRTPWLFQGLVYFMLLFLTVVFGAGGYQSAPFFIF